MVVSLVDQIQKGKLSLNDYPCTERIDIKDSRCQNVIVFIVGGVTYEEAKEIAITFNTAETRVLLGGTYIHNSKSFLTEIT